MKSGTRDTKYIQWVKLLGILLIVLNHSFESWNIYKTFSNDCQNPLMFFASGFVFSICLCDLNKYKTLKEVVVKKAWRLLVPYTLVFIFFYFPEMYVLGYSTYREDSTAKIIIDFLLCNNSNHLWFLYALFLMYVIFYVIRRGLASRGICYGNRMNLVTLAFLTLCYLGSSFLPKMMCISRIAFYFVFFYLGYVINLEKERIYDFLGSARNKKIGMISLLVLVAVIYYIDYIFGFISCHSTYSGGLIMKAFLTVLELVKQISMLLILYFGVFTFYKKNKGNNLVEYLADYSFYIYLFHFNFEQAFLQAINFVFGKTNVIISILAATVAIIGSIYLARMIERIKLGIQEISAN